MKNINNIIPYYFIAIHNEPYNIAVDGKKIERDYSILKQLIFRADEYNIRLTLMFSAQWVDYISSDFRRLGELEAWKNQGHEIAAHHHGIYHKNWDGFTDYPEEEVMKQRTMLGKEPEKYLGTLSDYIEKLKGINPGIKSGCMNDEVDKREMPNEIIYDTCSGFTNFGEIGRRLSDFDSPEKGRNDYIMVGFCNNIERKWLTHYQVANDDNQKTAQIGFNSLNSGIYGVVTHSIHKQARAFYPFLDFLHSKDPFGEKNKTITEIIEQKLLPEKYIPSELLNKKYTNEYGC